MGQPQQQLLRKVVVVFSYCTILTGCAIQDSPVISANVPTTQSSPDPINESRRQLLTAAPPQTTNKQDAVTQKMQPRWIREGTRMAERELADWKPDPVQNAVPDKRVRDRNVEITGEWVRAAPHRSDSSIKITRRPGGDYDFVLLSTGCFRGWELRRTATYADGVVVLDRPVKEHGSPGFIRLFALRVNGEVCLIPECNVEAVQSAMRKFGIKTTIGAFRYYSFGRPVDRADKPRQPKHKQQRPAAPPQTDDM